ncbi:MAG: InlB B-repeat-containing protein, partial [Lachnospiraceae bacterium]|nr:InlB B-repeat-containing protein [Lachnospiraceae bacterium]
MYRRLVSGILAFTMTVQLCTGTVYAAEKTKTASFKIDNEESETERGTTDEASFGSSSEDTEDTAFSETEEEAESSRMSELESEVNAESKTEDTTNAETNSKSETESTTKSDTEIQTESETEAETDIETEIETDTTDLQLSSEDRDDSEEEAFEEGNPDFLFQAGGFQVMDISENKISLFSEEDGISLLTEGDMDELSDILYTALKNKDASIDIRNYKFNYNSTEDRNQLLMLYYAVVNDHPDLYYVRTGYGVSYLTSSKTITKISPNYHNNIDEDAFEEGVEKAKSVVSDDMDDLQKAIAVHDYIVLNCEYDKERLANGTMPNESYSAYGALANQIAVCQGYALAYKYLMNEYGIDCYIVTSDKMNHAWNIVKINDALYQIDLTWDDPTWDKYGLVRHSYMLQSDEEFQKSSDDHSSHHDWYVTEGSGVVDIKAEGNIYDNAFWRDVNSPLVYDNSIDDKYYFVTKNKELQSWTYNIEATGEADTMIALDTPYSGLSLDGSKLYYNTSKNISYIDVHDADYTEQVRYSLEENDTDQIFGFTRNNNIIRYVKRAQYNISEKSTIYALDDSKETITEAEKKTYTVTFRDGFGTIFATRNVEEGGYAVPPAVTPPDGYKFSYWAGTYSNIRKDETVTAVYTKISYTISYVLNGGTNSKDNIAKYDVDTEFELADPTREYCDFGGWYE